MKLPDCEQAEISDRKLYDYLLDANHPQNKGKATFYELVGYNKSNAHELKNAILFIAAQYDVVKTIESEFGKRYVVEGRLTCPNNKSYPLRTVWFISNNDKTPRLVTAYPN